MFADRDSGEPGADQAAAGAVQSLAGRDELVQANTANAPMAKIEMSAEAALMSATRQECPEGS